MNVVLSLPWLKSLTSRSGGTFVAKRFIRGSNTARVGNSTKNHITYWQGRIQKLSKRKTLRLNARIQDEDYQNSRMCPRCAPLSHGVDQAVA